MKKIILAFFLLTLGVSKAQIVGGYLPVNSTKSFTAGNSTFSNVIARGTLSVGSTATVSGNSYLKSSIYAGTNAENTTTLGGLTLGYNTTSGMMHFGKFSGTSNSIWGYNTSTPTTLNYNLNFDANNAYFNSSQNVFLVTNGAIRSAFGTTSSYNTLPLRVGSNVTPTATLDVTGDMKVSSTFSLGSANLTGGNTGTVAVLSDALFSVHLFATVTNPADGTNYYFGNVGYQLSTTSTAGQIKLPYNCTLVGFDFDMVTSGASSTSETCTLSIAGSTNYTLSTAVTNTTAYSAINTNGLSQPFSANDVINAKLLSPTWATNPTAVYYGLTLWFVRRS